LESSKRLWRAVLSRRRGDPAEAYCPGKTIELEGVFAEELREAPVPGASPQLHLEKAVLSVYVALGEEQVPLVFGEDLGYPEAVAQNFHRPTKARKLHYTL
jgi:hypothetical protein